MKTAWLNWGGLRLTLLALAVVGALVLVRQGSTQDPASEKDLEKPTVLADAAANPNRGDPEVYERDRERYLTSLELARNNYVEWLESFNLSGADARMLEWSPIDSNVMPPPADVKEATGLASEIVFGKAISVEFGTGRGMAPIGEILVTFEVQESLKGDLKPGETIQVIFFGGPAVDRLPTGEERAVLRYFPAHPPLLNGEEAILLLQDAPQYAGLYESVLWVGVNKVVGGRVFGQEGGPLQSALTGRTPAGAIEFLRQIASP